MGLPWWLIHWNSSHLRDGLVDGHGAGIELGGNLVKSLDAALQANIDTLLLDEADQVIVLDFPLVGDRSGGALSKRDAKKKKKLAELEFREVCASRTSELEDEESAHLGEKFVDGKILALDFEALTQIFIELFAIICEGKKKR